MYCDRINDNLERFHKDHEQFLSDYMFQDACCMCVVQIGELAGLISEETRNINKSVPWRAIKDTRNFYVHAYGAIDLDAVWETITKDIPVLRTACSDMLKESDLDVSTGKSTE